MRLVPVYIDGEIALAEVAEIFKAAGWHVRMVGTQVIASRVPQFLRRDAHPANVVALNTRARVRKAQR